MSWDLFVQVSRPVSKEELNRTLMALEAPLGVEDEPSSASGYFHVLVANTGVNGLDGAFAGGFELSSGTRDDHKDEEDEEDDEEEEEDEEEEDGEQLAFWYSLSLHRGDDEATAWIVALGLAKAGDGFVDDPQEGRTYRVPALEKRWSGTIQKYRAAELRRWNALPAERKEFLQRREGETTLAYKDRLEDRAVKEGGGIEQQARHLQKRLEAALGAGAEGRLAEVLGLFPPVPGLLTAGLDPCFHANRADLARKYLARFPSGTLADHLVEAAGLVGIHAARYVAFLLEVGGSELDAQARARAASCAADPESRRLLTT